jgi:hypothetical protein
MALDCEMSLERELQGRADQLAILRHAERLKVICGRERAIRALETTLHDIRSAEPPLSECFER